MKCRKCQKDMPEAEENFGYIRTIGKKTGKPYIWKRPVCPECQKPTPFVQRKLDAMEFQWDSPEMRASFLSGRMIPGRKAWEFYSTHGFPLDLFIVTAREHGLTVNVRGFFECMEASR